MQFIHSVLHKSLSHALKWGLVNRNIASPRNLIHHYQTVLEQANLPVIRFHDFSRHTHATPLLAAGVHPKVVQERLGHSQISLTLDTYSHVIPSLQEEAAEKLNKLMDL